MPGKIEFLRLREILCDLYAAVESHPLNLHFLHYSFLREKRLFSQKFFVRSCTSPITDHMIPGIYSRDGDRAHAK